AQATGRAQEIERRARAAGQVAAAVRGAAQGAAGGTAAGQRRAGGKGVAPRGAERQGRAEEPRGRVGAPGAGGESAAALAQLQVQERVLREHVARAAHAAELAADPREAAGG